MPPASTPRTLPGPDVDAWDYASVDAAAGRLYLARSNSVSLVDLSGRSPPRSIGMVSHGHGVLPTPGTSNLVVSGRADDSVDILDRTDGHDGGRLRAGKEPAAIAFEKAIARAVVMKAKSGTVSVIDLHTNQVTHTVNLKLGLELERSWTASYPLTTRTPTR